VLIVDPKADGTPEEEHALLKRVEKDIAEFDGSSAGLERLLKAFSNLGDFYQLTGHLNEAEATYKEAVNFKETRAPSTVDASTMFVLSSIHTELGIVDRKREQYAAAVPHFEAALDIRKKLADVDPGTFNAQLAESWNNLGTALRKVGRHDDALKAYQHALEMRKLLVASGTPENHHDLANTHASMGTLFQEQGKLEESKAAFEAALDAHKQIPAGQAGPFMATRANLFNNLGIVKNDLKDFEGALASFRKALAIYEKAGGTGTVSRTPEMAMVCNNMASAYQANGQIEAAERAFLKGYDLYKGLVKQEPHVYSRYLKVAMENLRIFYSQIGKPEKGLLLVKDTLDFIQKVADVVDEKIEDVKGKIDEQLSIHTKKVDKKSGRNDPCPCGSGKKYKKCCMLKERA